MVAKPVRLIQQHPVGTLAAVASHWPLGPAAAFIRAALFLMRLLLQCATAPPVSSLCFHLSGQQLRSLKAATLRCASHDGKVPQSHYGDPPKGDSTEPHLGDPVKRDSTQPQSAGHTLSPTARPPWASTDDVLCALLWQVSLPARPWQPPLWPTSQTLGSRSLPAPAMLPGAALLQQLFLRQCSRKASGVLGVWCWCQPSVCAGDDCCKGPRGQPASWDPRQLPACRGYPRSPQPSPP